ncbi:MAG: 4-hydroxy-3-methylbut-2-enyl diphosphate reductase [Proteobacteria bacterium]|nr:4-hydroxy-3-methylbut-2-enyl diphosphate reductase [Pseudomonadota bacterium]
MSAPAPHRVDDVLLAEPRGFCAGVDRAIEIVERALAQFGAPIYVRHEIVHNRYVVDTLRRRGAVFVEDLEDVPDGATVIFSAHGVAPEVWEASRTRGLSVIDATCPLVTKVHLESLKYAKESYSIVVIGHEGHPEVIGTMGQSPSVSHLISTVKQAEEVELPDPDRVVALTQTTLSLEDTREIVDVLRARFPSLIVRNDICYATTNRQEAAKALVDKVDLMLVIGAQSSSNCNRLREVAADAGIPSYLIDDASLIQPAWLEGVERVGITSGASTPESLVEEVIDHLAPETVTTVEVIKEDVVFTLPKELRGKGEQKWARQRIGQGAIR